MRKAEERQRGSYLPSASLGRDGYRLVGYSRSIREAGGPTCACFIGGP